MRIIFLCVENSNRSQMAEAFGRIHGGDKLRQGKLEVFSAGSKPSGKVNPKAIEAMEELGYDLATHRSKGLEDLPSQEFDVAITMGCGDNCPTLRAKKRIDWQIPDPKVLPQEQFREVRDLIGQLVKSLLDEVA